MCRQRRSLQAAERRATRGVEFLAMKHKLSIVLSVLLVLLVPLFAGAQKGKKKGPKTPASASAS